MTKKCDICRHQLVLKNSPRRKVKSVAFCMNAFVLDRFESPNNPDGIGLDLAREICNREGDGIFVYFEPKEPAAGAAVQPDDWRKEMHKHMTKAA